MCGFIKNVKAKVFPVFMAAVALAAPIPALAAEGDTGVAATMESALAGVQADFMAFVGKAAPYAVGMSCVLLLYSLVVKLYAYFMGI